MTKTKKSLASQGSFFAHPFFVQFAKILVKVSKKAPPLSELFLLETMNSSSKCIIYRKGVDFFGVFCYNFGEKILFCATKGRA